jgi:hypothetical protein
MAEITPLILQAGSYDGDELRRIFTAMLAAEDFTTANDGGGVLTAGALKVTQNGTPNMSVNVGTGLALVRGSESTLQGYYLAGNDGTVNKTIAAADATNPRHDIVYLRVRDSVYSGSDDDGPIGVATGTPAASPSDPAIPDNGVALARVTVAALDTAINTGDIIDLRVASRLWTKPRGLVGLAEDSSGSQTGIVAETDVTGLTLTFTAPAGRRYAIRYNLSWYSTTSGNTPGFKIFKDGGSYRTHQSPGQGTAQGTSAYATSICDVTEFDTPAAGSHTYKLRVYRFQPAAGEVNIQKNSGHPAKLWIEDVGGYLI